MEIIKKGFVHREVELCKICGKGVTTKIDTWVAIIDYLGENHSKTGVYHRECLNELLKGKMKVMQSKFKKVGDSLKNLFNNSRAQNFEYN